MKINLFKNNKYEKIENKSIIYFDNFDETLYKSKYFSNIHNDYNTLFKVTNDLNYIKNEKKDYYLGLIVVSSKFDVIVSRKIKYDEEIDIKAELKNLEKALYCYNKYHCYRLNFVRIFYNVCKAFLLHSLWFYNPVKYFYDEGIDKSIRKIKGKGIMICNHIKRNDGFVFVRRYFPHTPFSPAIDDYYDNIPKSIAFWSRLSYVVSLKDRGALNTLISALYANRIVALFPEGEIPDNKDVIKVQEGTAYMAIKGHALIYPSVTLTPYKAFRRQYVIFGKPIDGSKFFKADYSANRNDVKKLTDMINQEMNRLKEVGLNKIKNKKKV